MNDLHNLRLLDLYHPVRDQLEECRHDSFYFLPTVDEFDTNGKVLTFAACAPFGVQCVMKAEACVRPKHTRPSYVTLEEKRKQLLVQEVFSRTDVSIQVNDNFERGTGCQHTILTAQPVLRLVLHCRCKA